MVELRRKYNKSIREKCPGGNETLDALNVWEKIRRRKLKDGTPEELKLAELAEEHLQQIKQAMIQNLKFPE